MGVTINGWSCVGETDHIVTLVSGDNRPVVFEYAQLVPAESDNRIVGWEIPDGPTECRWIMEVANADATQTMDILLIGGLPAQDPPEIVLPTGFSQVRLKPGYAQRVYYQDGIGWVPLFSGVLE